MSVQATVQTQTANPTFIPVTHSLLQRCTATTECDECRKKRLGTLQRASVNDSPVNEVPPIVLEVLRSPGQPLDAQMRAFMEPRFGHDFSSVRVHTDGKAAESARAVNALAYTVGRDVVFGTGQYTPRSTAGQRLIAHELAHTIQQQQQVMPVQHLRVGSTNDPLEDIAEAASEIVTQGRVAPQIAEGQRKVQRRIGDGHDLSSNRFARNAILEAVFDNERALRNGDRGTAVRLVQESLLAQGYALPLYGADSRFGDETEAAVRAFQIDAGARTLDGEIGPETMQLLDMRDSGATRGSGPLATPLPAGAPAPPAPTGVVFSEDPRETFSGYDTSVAVPHWLVVPENERRRARTAIAPAAARPTFVSANPAVATVDVVDGGIAVTGVAHGTTEIRAQAGAAILSRLRISVKRQLLRSVAFHNVRDSAVPPHRAALVPSANTMRSLLNRVWERQANIQFTGGAHHNIVVPGNLGAAVDWTSPAGGEWITVTALGAGANYNVFRVWRYMQDGAWPNDAANLGTNTLIGDNPCADGLGLAHECGHFLGLDHPNGFIMTPCGGRVNHRVSKAMADIVNP